MSGWFLFFAQMLFFLLGAWYFLRSGSRRKGGRDGISMEENEREMEKQDAMRQVGLTEPLPEQTRPKSLGESVGQERGIRALRAALCGPNPQHIIIYGPPGVGKTAAARLVLEEAKGRRNSPFSPNAKFVEVDATTLQFDERSIADPLLGSVHDPIYQGAGAFGQMGIPRPQPGAVSEANGGVLFIDEIGELHPIQMNRLLKVLEDRVAKFQSSYYSRENKRIPPYIHEIFQKGLPADFRLIGATTRNPSELPAALRSRCTEIFFDGLRPEAVEQIAADSMERVGLQYEDGLCGKIALYAGGGRDTVRLVQSLASLAEMKGRNWVGSADLEWVAEAGHYQPYPRQKVTAVPRVGVVNGLAVTGGMGGAVLTVEVKMLKSTAPYLQVTGIVEEEEIRSPHGVSKRKSNARSSAENVLTVLEGYGFDRSRYAVHINFPGGMPVDGPSAGTAMFLAAYSAFTGAAVPGDVALTGEISLTGNILPVGGVTEKLQAAEEAGVTRAYIPKANWQGRYERLGLEAVPVEEISELLEMVFTKKEEKQAGMPQRGILTAEGLQK
ncbi:MAG: S16 family serine protease [Anaerotignum sp.]|uniref:S16 family serine protease n=1 Tax=Anaerotignum sp. TaxID=2039241 RepID=UPI003994CA6E